MLVVVVVVVVIVVGVAPATEQVARAVFCLSARVGYAQLLTATDGIHG